MSKRSYDNKVKFSSKRRCGDYFNGKKHTLDSDEEDNVDENEGILNTDDIEGEEDGISRQDDGVRMSAFNMKEEMEEGHFDKHGHFIWKNEAEIRDNWLDNVDWHKINKNDNSKYQLDSSEKGLGDESDSDEEDSKEFNLIETYKDMLKLMKPTETVNKSIKRLGGDNSKLSSIERLKRKKAGTLNTNPDVTKLTELANSILTKTGNMDIYQETFEQISIKVDRSCKPTIEPTLDMYSDDFEIKEQEKMQGISSESDCKPPELMWEFKWQQDSDEIEGPYDNQQMTKWASEGYFKTGVWVRKCGENSQFYTSNRIDFELYD